jgi:hypothetical protein
VAPWRKNNTAWCIYVNEKQRQFLAVKQKRRSFVGERGSGKTTVAGHETQTNYLPRAKGFLVGLTYTQLTSNTRRFFLALLPTLRRVED